MKKTIEDLVVAILLSVGIVGTLAMFLDRLLKVCGLHYIGGIWFLSLFGTIILYIVISENRA